MEQVLKDALVELKEVYDKFNSHKIGKYELAGDMSKIFKELKSKGVDLTK